MHMSGVVWRCGFGWFPWVPAICSACQKEIEELAAAEDAAGVFRRAALRFNGRQGSKRPLWLLKKREIKKN